MPDLKMGLTPLDSVIMTIPSSPIQSSITMVHVSSLPPGVGGHEPHYNLRPLAIRKGKGPVVGGLELDVGSIGPRKLRGRKSNLSKAQFKAIIDIAGGKQMSFPGVLRAKKSPPESSR